MALQDSLSERLFYTNRKKYTNQEGNIAYLDPKGLKRPFSMPMAQRVIAAVIVLAAIFIGYIAIDKTILNAYREAESFQTTLEENLSRPASIESLPNVASFMPLDNEAIMSSLTDAGMNYYDMTELYDSYDLMLCKLPSDVTAEQAADFYSRGIGSLEATDATKILNGSWTLGVDNEYATDIVRYCDFSTGDPQIAVQNAIAKEGFNPESITETGVDDSGNTFSTGTLDTDDGHFIWKVSALPLDEIYSIRGMPENVCYVGVRLTWA